jgi:hypothetical protein
MRCGGMGRSFERALRSDLHGCIKKQLLFWPVGAQPGQELFV